MQNVGELATADCDVAGKQRAGALDDVHIHRRGPDIKERHHLRFIRLVVDLVAVLECEGVDVDHDRLFAGELDRVANVVDAFALAGGDQHIRRVVPRTGDLVVKADIGEIVRDMLFGVPVDRFLKLVLAHRRQDDVLDDDGMAAHTGNDVIRVHLVVGAYVADHVRNRVQLHDLTVDDRVVGQILEAEAYEIQVADLSVKLNHFDRTRTDIQTGNAFLFTEQHYFFSLLSGRAAGASETGLIFI